MVLETMFVREPSKSIGFWKADGVPDKIHHMSLILKLVQSSCIPYPLPEWAKEASYYFSLRGLIAFPGGHNNVWIGRRELDQCFEYTIPSNARFVALHPSWQKIGIITSNAILITGRTGEILAESPVRHDWGLPQSCIFDMQGEVLLVSFTSRQYRCARVYRIGSLECIQTIELDGDEDSVHTLFPHPTEPMIILEVGNGQHETSTYLIELRPHGAKILLSAVTEYPRPTIGFTCEGRSVLRSNLSELEVWSYPEWKNVETFQNVDRIPGVITGDIFSCVGQDSSSRFFLEEYKLPQFEVIRKGELFLPSGTGDVLALGNDHLYSSYTTNKKRISPADCTPESKTFQLWKVLWK